MVRHGDLHQAAAQVFRAEAVEVAESRLRREGGGGLCRDGECAALALAGEERPFPEYRGAGEQAALQEPDVDCGKEGILKIDICRRALADVPDDELGIALLAHQQSGFLQCPAERELCGDLGDGELCLIDILIQGDVVVVHRDSREAELQGIGFLAGAVADDEVLAAEIHLELGVLADQAGAVGDAVDGKRVCCRMPLVMDQLVCPGRGQGEEEQQEQLFFHGDTGREGI